MNLSQKDLLELKYWISADMDDERAMQRKYLKAMGPFTAAGSVLEIGTGPHWGMLPRIRAARRVGVDPLYQAYWELGLRDDALDIVRIEEKFEQWDTNDTFDLILSANALDHGEMGFHLLPKVSRLLNPGGRFHLHVHLRPAELLNLIHDHSLTVEALDRNLAFTDLVEVRREFFERDIDDCFCRTLVGIWQKPA